MKIIKKITFITIFFSVGILAACWTEEPTKTPRSTPSLTTSGPSPTTSVSNPSNNNNSGDSNIKVNISPTPPPKSGGFQGNVPSGFQMPTDSLGQKMLREYGAMFIAKGVTPPSVVVFKNDAEVSAFQSGLQRSSENIGGFTIELQSKALTALKEAITEAKGKNLSIKPRNADSSRRTYTKVLDNWAKNVNGGLSFWIGKGKLKKTDADRIKGLSPVEQISEIFKLEDQGIFFSTDHQKSIIYSVAPPGTSQHLSMMALDVAEFDSAAVREILAKHGWFQTVVSDMPHFTYLGVQESELPNLGLKKESLAGRTFWIPDI